MSENYVNEFGQPIGFPLENWLPLEYPPATAMEGRYCRVEPLDVELHAADLWQAFSSDPQQKNWTYLPYGPFADEAEFREWMTHHCQISDPLFYALIPKESSRAAGFASYLRITPHIGVTEVGHVSLSPLLQCTPAATEAMFLMMRRVFEELGYRRYEWKCDALNASSRKAALRLGFQFEGIFRQATVYKQRNRDTAWFSILDHEWPLIKLAIEDWLAADNFNVDGEQLTSLSAATRKIRTLTE